MKSTFFTLVFALLPVQWAQWILALTYTWGGSTSNAWATGSNWITTLPKPLNDDTLVFPTTWENKNMRINLPAGETIHLLRFDGSGIPVFETTIQDHHRPRAKEIRAVHRHRPSAGDCELMEHTGRSSGP